ncbi:MAG TPA: DRTGG domain-containing protein, partial [Rugosimonospora sp.]|nr:DRTGG domain-containing protein [Rugosimonospora sp.]
MVALGVAELLSRRVPGLGVFRPVVAEPDDQLLDMLSQRYRIGGPPAYGVTDAEAGRLLAEGRLEELVGRVVTRYRAVAEEHPVVVVVGTDLDSPDGQAGVGSREMALRARLATELGSVVIGVVDGQRGTVDDLVDSVRGGYHALRGAGADVLAVVANRVPTPLRRPLLDALHGLAVPVYAIPEVPGLSSPTVAEVVRELHATELLGRPEAFTRDVGSFVVGAAQVPTVLDHLTDGCLLITPGDRADLIVAAAAAHAAGTVSLAGVMLTLGLRPDPRVLALVERTGTGLPLIAVDED